MSAASSLTSHPHSTGGSSLTGKPEGLAHCITTLLLSGERSETPRSQISDKQRLQEERIQAVMDGTNRRTGGSQIRARGVPKGEQQGAEMLLPAAIKAQANIASSHASAQQKMLQCSTSSYRSFTCIMVESKMGLPKLFSDSLANLPCFA